MPLMVDYKGMYPHVMTVKLGTKEAKDISELYMKDADQAIQITNFNKIVIIKTNVLLGQQICSSKMIHAEDDTSI